MPAFRQVGEKQLPNPILYMAWSPNRDLIALANTSGEVLLLHRLANFQRVWSLLPNENTGKEITSLAWRPDGKVLAFSVGDTKQVVLCDAEKAEILHLFPVEYPASCMHWMEVQDDSRWGVLYKEDPFSFSIDDLVSFIWFIEEKSDEVTNLLGEVRLNILVVGGPSGFVELYAYGLYKIATLSGISGTCRSLGLSSDLKSLSVITEIRSTEDNPEIHYIQLDTGLLSSCLPELTKMARKFTHISTLLQYLRLSLTCMCEAWEDILMQMDLRLTKFVQEKNTSTQVQDEFLELLLWGHASPELQALLMNQLTVKGLKMLGQSIDSSYSSIQKLVISHLQSGSEALLYHLSEVKGMALWKQKFQPLGLDPAAIEDAIVAVGSFTLKASELLQVIDKSMKNFKAFFRWLYVGKLHFCMTQKDLAFVADFLSEHFSELFDRKGKYFNVERVGQYLKDEDEDLVSPPNMEGNQWVTFVKQSTYLKESPLLFPTYPQKSLHFVKRMMEGSIDLCLQKPAKAGMHYVVFCMPEISPSKIYILRRATDPNSDSSYSCLDARFYDNETLTVVLRSLEDDENKMRVLAQLHLNSALSWDEEFTWDLTLRLEQQTEGIPVQGLTWRNQSREMDNIKAQFVAVNGIRKVACMLSANLRHIRVFEMDAEEEEEEEERADESQEMSLDQDRLEDTMTNQSDAGEGRDGVGGAEEAQVAGQGSGDILDETAGSDKL
uniref:Anaphase-promoting complex subunit 4 n=1 Tax=Sinocyclocheilus rhinocerous TaxID=307959 RepID=A0A673H405_9TELE